MERAEESNESGYDGGSQENILSEPHYESIGSRSENGKEPKKRGSKEKIEPKDTNRDSTNNKERKASLSDNKKVPNGHAKFCNGVDEKEFKNDEEECPFESNQVTIHAVIETVHSNHTEHKEVHLQPSEVEEIYEEIPEPFKPEKKQKSVEKVEKIPVEPTEENKETIYSHISVQKTVKKIENDKKVEKNEERNIVQELVKVAEDEGVPPKTPTPPPRNNKENNDDSTFVEEEYSYEPELKKSSSKLVLRTRSLLNLEEENTKSDRTYVRPPAVRMKITTGPDGTFVIDGRKATSELNLAEECRNGSSNIKKPISGEELRRRKEEIFKPKELPVQDSKKYYDEINQNKTRTTKEEAIYNLKKYLKENNIGLKELLTNNNVVIIDTYREKKAPEDLAEYNHKSVGDCRITGTTAKGEMNQSHTLPRANRVHQPVVQRHYFYRLVKARPSPPDEELPDPDKVRDTRQMFQKSKEKVPPTAIMLPIAAKVGNPKKEARPTPEVRLVQSDRSPRRWTDSGSLSSGVSSDMSLLDNMSDKCYSSDEEEEEEEPISPTIEAHPVSPEVLKKIRACGTTITFYGGRVISHSSGPENPMTMTIMDEIRQGREGGRGKFRLVKSNSCGSRLELAGTDDHHYQELSRGRFYEDVYGGKPLSEEMKGSLRTVHEERRGESIKTSNNRKHINGHDISKWVQKNPQDGNGKKPLWRELIESRKQKRAMEHNRRPCTDMVFEEFEVMES